MDVQRKKMCYVMKITKQRLAEGLSLPWLHSYTQIHAKEFSTVTCKTNKQTEAFMYGVFSTLEGLCVQESGSPVRAEVSDYASDDRSTRGTTRSLFIACFILPQLLET